MDVHHVFGWMFMQRVAPVPELDAITPPSFARIATKGVGRFGREGAQKVRAG